MSKHVLRTEKYIRIVAFFAKNRLITSTCILILILRFLTKINGIDFPAKDLLIELYTRLDLLFFNDNTIKKC